MAGDGRCNNTDGRPRFLVVLLAVSASVFALRIAGGIMDQVFGVVTSYAVFVSSLDWEYPIRLVFGLSFAALVAIWQHAILERRSRAVNGIVLALFVMFAILPIRFGVPYDETLVYEEEDVAARRVRVELRWIVDNIIQARPTLTNEDVRSAIAMPIRDGGYGVLLSLTDVARRAIRYESQSHIGDRLGVFLDGELRSAPRITAPLHGSDVFLPLCAAEREARRIATGITMEGD